MPDAMLVETVAEIRMRCSKTSLLIYYLNRVANINFTSSNGARKQFRSIFTFARSLGCHPELVGVVTHECRHYTLFAFREVYCETR